MCAPKYGNDVHLYESWYMGPEAFGHGRYEIFHEHEEGCRRTVEDDNIMCYVEDGICVTCSKVIDKKYLTIVKLKNIGLN